MIAKLYDSIGRLRVKATCRDYVSDINGLVLLTLSGASVAVRACWAHLINKQAEATRKSNSHARIDTDLYLCSANEAMQVEIATEMKLKTKRMDGYLLVMRSDALPPKPTIVLGGSEEEPSPWFARALENLDGTPFLVEWLPEMWKRGLAHPSPRLIEPLSGHTNIAVWSIWPSERYWRKIVTAIAKEATDGTLGSD